MPYPSKISPVRLTFKRLSIRIATSFAVFIVNACKSFREYGLAKILAKATLWSKLIWVFDSISEVAIRYELIPKLYIEAVNGGSNTIDIYYQFNIEGSQNKRAQND